MASSITFSVVSSVIIALLMISSDFPTSKPTLSNSSAEFNGDQFSRIFDISFNSIRLQS